MKFTFRVDVLLKPGVADPQGSAVQSCLQALGHEGIVSVGVGKRIDVAVEAADAASAERSVRAMCDAALVNAVMETYTVALTAGGDAR